MKCPKCGKACELMAGINIPGGDRKQYYWACWSNGLAAIAREPVKFAPMGQSRLVWRDCSPFHKQAVVSGQVVDWWPTRGKFRFKGQTHKGDPREHLKSSIKQAEIAP